MSKNYYKHFQNWEKAKLERILNNQPICVPVYGVTHRGWGIIQHRWLVNISQLAFQLRKDRKTIKNELLRGSYWTLVNSIAMKSTTLSYSKDASDRYKKEIIKKRRQQNTKILTNPKLCDFVASLLVTQSLKGIGGRSKIAFKAGLIETTISHTTLYGYIDNENIKFIDSKALKRRKKRHYRMKYAGKRQNGVSIKERPELINNKTEFGHWEIDLIEGKRGTKINLITMYERKTKKGIAIKIKGKEKETITGTLKMLQKKDTLIYGKNVKSITSDNGSEFWGWETFCKSIYNSKDDINVFFTNPYCSWEKGGVENFNGQIRRKYRKGTDFTNISQTEIDKTTLWINGLFRESLQYRSADEEYNVYVSN